MTLNISRDANGHVTILDPTTGKAEVIATKTLGRPAVAAIKAAEPLPSHNWARVD